MTEQEAQEGLNLEWKEAIEQGIQDALDSNNYALFGQVNFAPASLGVKDDNRGFPELSLKEQYFIEQIVY